MKWKVVSLGFLLAAAAVSAHADAGDPPSRVARLNYQSGSVAFRPGSVEEWAAATLNYPLTTGDHLWTDPGAQAEMHIGSTALRMSSQTALAFLNLDDQSVQLSLTEGTLEIRVRSMDDGDLIEVDTPNVAITLLQPGDYRIDVDGDRNRTAVATRDGEAEVNGGGDRIALHGGQRARINGENAESREVDAAPPPDAFDRWCEDRDRPEEQSLSAQYTGPDMTGYEDLDRNGVWNEEPDYGWVWAPRTVAVDWAPYRYGHWAWIAPWGWTWIDDEPWGFAPFHYGRWAFLAGRWVWAPGRMAARPVYAPALVVFVGGGGFGVGIGTAAWFPLGPHEPYRPVYRASDRYLRQVNIRQVNAVDLRVDDRRHLNRGVPGAITVVSQDVFVGARPVHRDMLRISDRDLSRAQVLGNGAPIAPRRESVLGGPAHGMPPARFAERGVVVRTAPPPPPVAFHEQQRDLERNQGRPLDAGTLDALRPGGGRNPMVRRVVTPPANAAGDPGQRPARSGWRPGPPAVNSRTPEVPAGNTPRDQSPRRVMQPPAMPAPAPDDGGQPRGFGQRNQDRNRPAENRGAEPALSPETPRQTEAPRPAEPARQAEPRRADPRSERPARETKSEPSSKRSERKDVRKDQQP